MKSIKKGAFFSSYSYKDEEIPPSLRKNASEASKKKTMALVIKNKCQTASAEISKLHDVLSEYFWLTDKFGKNGIFQNVSGVCRAAELSEIEAKGWSLTPGAYVGVAPVEDDGVDFKARMAEIHVELLTLQAQSNELMETISRNMEGLGL